MSKEEKKAIEMLNKYITEHKLFNIKQADNLEENIKIVLHLVDEIEVLKKEIEELKLKCEKLENKRKDPINEAINSYLFYSLAEDNEEEK